MKPATVSFKKQLRALAREFRRWEAARGVAFLDAQKGDAGAARHAVEADGAGLDRCHQPVCASRAATTIVLPDWLADQVVDWSDEACALTERDEVAMKTGADRMDFGDNTNTGIDLLGSLTDLILASRRPIPDSATADDAAFSACTSS